MHPEQAYAVGTSGASSIRGVLVGTDDGATRGVGNK
jgi:hypothetical protein